MDWTDMQTLDDDWMTPIASKQKLLLYLNHKLNLIIMKQRLCYPDVMKSVDIAISKDLVIWR